MGLYVLAIRSPWSQRWQIPSTFTLPNGDLKGLPYGEVTQLMGLVYDRERAAGRAKIVPLSQAQYYQSVDLVA